MNNELENKVAQMEAKIEELEKLVKLLKQQLAQAQMPIEMYAARFNK